VVVRELGPLLANIVVIGRSGNAIAAELGHMRLAGEVRVLDAQGLDPLVYLVVPRTLATMIAVLCLAVIFIVVCLCSGYWFGWLLGARTGGFLGFLDSVARALGRWDLLNVVAKSLVPGLLAGVICATQGLGVADSITDVPTAIARAVGLARIAGAAGNGSDGRAQSPNACSASAKARSGVMSPVNTRTALSGRNQRC